MVEKKNETPLVPVDGMTLNVKNDEYELPEGVPVYWHVYSTLERVDDAPDGREMYSAAVGILGPTEKTHEEISAWVAEEMFHGVEYEYRGAFDHEPTQEEVDALFPTSVEN